MTTENINIIVRENGSRVVKRNFDLMARQALTTNSAVSVLSRSLLGLTGGISVAIGIRTFMRTLADFSQALSTVQAITGGTGQEFADLEAEIKRLGATTRFTATQAAEGAQFLARAGFDAVQVTESLNSTLLLAQSTATGFGRSADIVTNIMTAFRLETTETARVGDVLAMATNRSNTNLSQLGDAMKFVAPIAKGLNVGLEETVAMISVLSDAGLQGSIAGTGLRRVMTELEVAARKQGKTLKALGVDTDATQVSIVGLTAAIQTLSEAGLDTGRAMQFFGQRGGPAFENLGSYIPKIKEMNVQRLNSEGFMAEVARGMDDNLNGAILAVQSATEALIIAIGDSGAFTILQGIMGTLAASLRFVANNIDIFAKALQALIAIKVGRFILNFIARNRELAVAISAGNATQLTSIGIEKAKAASSLQMAQASSVAAAAKVRELQVGVAEIGQRHALLLQQKKSIIIDNQRRLARDALTGRFIAYNAAVAQNIRTNRALMLTERTMTATKTQLTAAIAAQTGATNALTAAQGRQAAAAAASLTLTARLSRAFPLLAGAIATVSGALIFMKALILANPITAIIAGIALAVAAFVTFSDRIKIAGEEFVTLKDMGAVVFDDIADFVSVLGRKIRIQFSGAFDFVTDTWEKLGNFFERLSPLVLESVKTLMNMIIGLYVGAYRSVTIIWNNFPLFMKGVGQLAHNALLDITETAINSLIDMITGLFGFIDRAFERFGREAPFASLADMAKVDFTRFKVEVDSGFTNLNRIIQRTFTNSLSEDFIGNAWSNVLERARDRALRRVTGRDAEVEIVPGNLPLDDGGGGGSDKKTFSSIIQEMQIQNELLRVNAQEREILSKIISIENDLKRSLTETEKGLVAELMLQNEVLKVAADVYEQIHGPARQYETALAAINELLREGRISQEQFTQAMIKARLEFLDTQVDALSGVERGFLKIMETTADFSKKTEEIITGTFESLSAGFADFVTTGKADFGSLIETMSRQLAELAFSQLFQAVFGNIKIGGIPMPEIAGFRAKGGPVMSGQKYIVGEKGPEVFTPGVQGHITPNGVSGNMIVNIHNNTGSPVREERRSAPNGDQIVDVFMGEIAKGRGDKAIGGRFGMKPSKVRR